MTTYVDLAVQSVICSRPDQGTTTVGQIKTLNGLNSVLECANIPIVGSYMVDYQRLKPSLELVQK
jgi:hypothetical protein